MTEPTINWTPAMLVRFREAYDAAVFLKVDTFRFDGNEFVTSYAKYLIEYLTAKFTPKK